MTNVTLAVFMISPPEPQYIAQAWFCADTPFPLLQSHFAYSFDIVKTLISEFGKEMRSQNIRIAQHRII